MNKKVLVVVLVSLGILGILGGVWVLNKGQRDRGAPNQSKLGTGQAPDIKGVGEVRKEMKVTSSAFQENERIPVKYSCQGEDFNPPLTISEMPQGTGSLVLIMDDPDAPGGTWDHWLVFNIAPMVREIAENSLPEGGVEIVNSFDKKKYGGPCPPPGPAHRYFFKAYALDSKLNSQVISNKESLLTAMEGHILASGELTGTYSR